jgi:LysW-gamma-L-lysine/LysW-L-ornithine aminotransferase
VDIIASEKLHTSGVYPKRELAIVRGDGAIVWDDQGREYIDCTSGHGVAIIGHNNPYVADAVCQQVRRLVTLSEVFYNDRRAEALAKLVEIAPKGLDRAFLSNSGTEAVEAGIKFARLSTGKPGIIAAMRGFHGRTMGSLSATWEKKYRGPFEPLVPGFSHVPYNNIGAMAEAINDRTAAVLVELVQGEGGVRPATPEYVTELAQLCRDRGVLLIIDEVQTGFGRTGKMFACEHYDLTPDILCLGKAIGGGVPMGAAMFGPRVGGIQPGSHGSTFGGNPLACAASVAAIRYMQDHDLPGQSARKGQFFIDLLRKNESPKVREVRGLGLMTGVELREKVQPYLVALMGQGVLALPAGKTVLRFLPPLVISEAQLERVAEAVRVVLELNPQGAEDEE